MSNHPINLALRFLLELAALAAMGAWRWQKGDGLTRYVPVVVVPLAAAAIWGTFRVPGDPGKAPIAVPGMVRLGLEIVFFAFATWALFDAGLATYGWVFGALVLLHYLTAYDRIFWLLKQ